MHTKTQIQVPQFDHQKTLIHLYASENVKYQPL